MKGSLFEDLEDIQCQDWASARTSLRRLYAQKPGVGSAQMVRRYAKAFANDLLGTPTRVAFLRSFTIEPLIPLIEAEALLAEIDATIQVGGFNSYVKEILDPKSDLYEFAPDVIFLAVQARDFVPDLWDRFAELSAEAVTSTVEQAGVDISNFVETIRSRSPATIVLQTMEVPPAPSWGILDAQLVEGQNAAFHRLNAWIRRIATQRPGVFVLDYDGIVNRYGKAPCFDQHKWAHVRMPITSEAIPAIAHEYFKFVLALTGKVRKVLVTDLDNTLWGGVIGEEGLAGIRIGADYPGVSYLRLQRAILDVSLRGILLAVCSKNNEADALEVLDKHPAMLLRSHHFACMKINWQDKPQNLRAIATELNVGIDSLVFLDDNLAERDIVARYLPEVHVIELPKNESGYADAVRNCACLERLALSAEDRDRSRHYTTERQRQAALIQSVSLEDFYRSLEMQASISRVKPDTISRVAQLTQKTNQFNLTTRRYSEQQIAEMIADSAAEVYALRSRDRFGDNGVVGAAISRYHNHTCEIDTFLLSCRVIGRTLEAALLHHIAEEARKRGTRYLQGWFFPTTKNAPASRFYSSQGFELLETKSDGKQLWQADLDQLRPTVPGWIGCPSSAEVKNP